MTPVLSRYVAAFGKKPVRSSEHGRLLVHLFSASGTTWALSEGLGRGVELVWSRKGKVTPALAEAVAAWFGLVGSEKISPGATLARPVPGFDAMTHALFAKDPFSIELDGAWISTLEQLSPRRTLLAVRPLFEAEAAAVQKNAKRLEDTLVQVRWEDPTRKPFAGPAPGRKPAPARAAKGLGARLDALLAKLRTRHPLVFDALIEQAGADQKTLTALERKLKTPLHADLRTLLTRFDGGAPLLEYTTLSASEIPRWAKAPKKPGVPFAADGGGNLFCLDDAGRVQQWEIRGRGTFERAASLDALINEAIKAA